MRETKLHPLYPTADYLSDLQMNDFPTLKDFLSDGQSWRKKHWLWGQSFLVYVARNKSPHTFNRFRNEIERFLLWLFLKHDQPMDKLKKVDILQFADFCWAPDIRWIGVSNHDKFELSNGFQVANKAWLPYRLVTSKHPDDLKAADKNRYQPSQQTLTAMFTALVAFYKFLMNEELVSGNPAQLAKADCRYFIKDAQVKEVRRLNDDHWQYLIQAAETLADQDAVYERNLFVIVAMKTLFLRISELSERPNWSPVMQHFWQDAQNNWWLKIYGKGRKLRDITVPDSFLPYLKRYRVSRDLSPLPSSNEHYPLVEKLRGRGGMSSRQLARIVQQVLDQAYETMAQHEGQDNARKLKEASTHWLRHTGASMEIERGRALKDVSEDLGHASMATTDTVYVQTETRKRAASGKNRSVK